MDPLLRFIIRRVLQMIPTILAVSLLIFVIFSVIPGSFTSSLIADGKGRNDPKVVEQMNKEFGLDKPVYQRFGSYVVNLAQLDLGQSFRTRQPVTHMLLERAWPTIKLAIAAMAIAILIGVPLGFVAALKPGSLLDTATMIAAVSGLSLPQFWLGLLAMYVFALTLGWLPSFGYGDGGIRNLILPAVTLSVAPLALLARTTRAAVLDVMSADFIRTARSKGMNAYRLVTWHLMRNALVLIITTVGLQFGSLMGQAVVIEKLFSWPGLGSLLVDSVSMRDIPVVQGAILMIVLWFLIINTVVDVLYAVIDPRISHG
jgi:peptide/nickel transport system permease protein